MASVNLTEKLVSNLPAPTDAAQAYYWDDDPIGFGVVVGKTGARTFIVRGRVARTGERVKVTIGQHRAPRAEGDVWTVVLARQRARELLGRMASGVNPNAKLTPSGAPANGPTLRDGMEAHLARMRKKHRSERTVHTFETELTKYLAAWLDRPIAELTGAVLVDLHDEIKRNAKARAGTNPHNDKGAALANRVITHVSAAWNSLNKKLEGKLGSWNPAKAVDKDVLKPKRERIDGDKLADWGARVATMRNPIQRDGLMLALYTGLRSEDVRTVRWEHVDWKARTLELPDPKGGEGAAFKIPLSPTVLEILKRRKHDNAKGASSYERMVVEAGGDHGWAFPGLNSDGKVNALDDLRQQVHGEKHGRFPAESPHVLRRTWESIAHEEGISELDQHVLSNHSFGSHNVNATYIAQHIDHLASCAAKIDAGITRRLKPKTPKGRARARRDHLQAVA